MLRRLFVMDSFNVGKLPIEEDKSSSSSSSDNDVVVAMGAYMQNHELVQQQMTFLLQLSQTATEPTPSPSTPQMKKRFIKRDRKAAHNRLYKGYFADDSLYNEHQFRRRFRMRRHLFLRIVEALGNHSQYFQVRYDAAGKRGCRH